MWTSSSNDKFTATMQQYQAAVSTPTSTTSTAPSGPTLVPVYITQAVATPQFQIDVLSVVVAEIVFTLIALITHYAVKRWMN